MEVRHGKVRITKNPIDSALIFHIRPRNPTSVALPRGGLRDPTRFHDLQTRDQGFDYSCVQPLRLETLCKLDKVAYGEILEPLFLLHAIVVVGRLNM